MGFWKDVDMDVRQNIRLWRSSYNDELKYSIQKVANEKYGKGNKAKMV